MNPLFLIDFYKVGHVSQYPTDTQQVWSNWTPRSARVPCEDGVVFFGLQYFIKEILQQGWDWHFFGRPLNTVLSEYRELIKATLGVEDPRTDHIENLWKHGYLPIDIWALPEGTSSPLRVPQLVITNTVDHAYWLPNYLETILSNILWKGCTSATTARRYRKIFTKYAKEFGEKDLGFIDWMGHDFSFRGMSGKEDAILSGMGHLLSFSGTDTIPAILAAKEYYNADLTVGGSVPACYDDQTEILTDRGFVLFKNLSFQDKVAQYTPEDAVEFVLPEDKFVCPYKGKMISFNKKGYRYIDALVTPNHKMVKRWNTGDLEIFRADEGNYSHRSAAIVAGKAAISGSETLSALDRLRIAFQADGSFPSRYNSYTGARTGTKPIRFSFKKDRKADRLDLLLSELKYEYTKERYQNGYYSFWIKVPQNIEFVKDLSWIKFDSLTASQAKEIVKEFAQWDGSASSKNTLSYYTTSRSCADIAQAVGVLAGYKTQFGEYNDKRFDHERQTNFTITFTTSKTQISGEDIKKEEIDYDGIVYCVKVPTGMIVTRRNGVVLISGNTEHSVMCAGEKDNEFDTFKRLLTEVYPSGIVSVVSDTWDLWKVLTDYVPKLKDTILSREGKLVIRPDSGDPVKIMCGGSETWCKNSESIQKGVLRLLAETLGTDGEGHINKAGSIYGDSITPERAEEIMRRTVRELKLSPYNVVLGIGSFTYEFVTRDTYGFAMKATAVKRNGKIIDIFKKPVTDSGEKNSLKGIPAVYWDKDHYRVFDQRPPEALDECDFRKVFSNGNLLVEENFSDIRSRVRKDV